MNYQELTQDKLDEYKQAFRLFDFDNNGSITIKELGNIMSRLGQHASDEELRIMLAEGQEEQDKLDSIDFNIFMRLILKKKRDLDTETELIEAFKIIDSEGNGILSIENLKTTLLKFGSLTSEELDLYIKEADFDSDGYINYEEFVKYVLNH